MAPRAGAQAQSDAALARIVPSVVRVERTACTIGPVRADALAVALRTELASDTRIRVVVADAANPPASFDDTARVAIEAQPCTAQSSAVRVVVEHAITGRRMLRTLALDDVRDTVRVRVSALVVADMLRDGWSALTVPQAGGDHMPSSVVLPPLGPANRGAAPGSTLAASRPAATSSAATGAVRPPLVARPVVGLSGEFRAFPTFNGSLAGVRFSTHATIAGPLRFRFDAATSFGAARDVLGFIDLGLASGGVGLMLAAGRAAVRVEVGPRIEMGAAWASGRPNDPDVVSGAGVELASLLLLDANLRVRIAGAWWATLGFDFGGVLSGIAARSDGRTTTGIGGIAASARIGLAIEP